MPRTPLASFVRKIQLLADATRHTGMPVEELLGAQAGRKETTRREFLDRSVKGALALGAGLAVPGAASAHSGPRRSNKRIVIIGAGLAGLTCAYRLKQRGYNPVVFEAADRIGGRCYTKRSGFTQDQFVERGGEFIDTGHKEVRRLAKQLGLKLDDLFDAYVPDTYPILQIGGAPYDLLEATVDFLAVVPKLQADLQAAGFPTLYNSYTPRGYALDHISITDWIQACVPGGMASRMGQLLDLAYTIENGAESSTQSALNLVLLAGKASGTQLELFGDSDSRFRIRGGNDQLVSRLSDELCDAIQPNRALTQIKRRSDGRYEVTVAAPGGGFRVELADKLVLALPFSILRSEVQLAQSGFSPLKRIAIDEQGMGMNTKLHLQFRSRYWNTLGNTGDIAGDMGIQNSWEATRAQEGNAGILTNFSGGNATTALATGSVAGHAAAYLHRIEPLLPGLTARYNGRAHLDFWPGYRWTKGSYSFWKVGQYTRFVGIEGAQEGNCHFCGEHTSIEYAGYLNGAVETGGRVAREIDDDLG